ncbi:Mu-like prophage major head subunit gpT family protein [Laribacter hongkongensis]|nr:Mu-like prophage major head subunit gpT family protein [Laribacter hongkongensis]MCG9027475.1 Mu-like prophage major head subunit gpT family protein [Laribacter hongkongensis]
MLINAGSLKAIFVSLKTIFNNAFDAAPSQWQQVAMLVQSTGKSNDYAWLSSFPRMRKWIGEKAVKALAASQYTIVNDDWEATVEVDRNDIKDDQLGIYRPQAEMAGFSAKQLPDEIIFDLVSQGFTRPCYDGQ